MAEMQRWALVATLDAHRVAGKIGLASGEGVWGGVGGVGEGRLLSRPVPSPALNSSSLDGHILNIPK